MRAHSVEGETDTIITGSSDGTIRVWERRVVDENTGKHEHTIFVNSLMLI
jgi:WD40 repeat protein